jgi:hypothetical protein
MESIPQRCTETLVAMEQVLSEPIKDSATTPWARFRDIHWVEQVATAECNLEGGIIHAVGEEGRVCM